MSEKNIEFTRVTAYYIWESEGRPAGRDCEIWAKAEKKVAAQSNVKTKVAFASAKKAPAKKKSAPQKTTTPKINLVPVKSKTAKIITPLYGSVKK